MKTRNFFGISLALAATVLLAGCPKQINQARNGDSNLSAAPKSWGVPVTHMVTAGFNGSPSEQVGVPSKPKQ